MILNYFREAIKKLPNFGHCPNLRGPSQVTTKQPRKHTLHTIWVSKVCRGDPFSRSKIPQRVKHYPTILTTFS